MGLDKNLPMYNCDIVFIKGNPNSGLPQQHEKINKTITELINSYTYKIIDSNETYRNALQTIPKAKVYIGFSRGSRYLNRLPKKTLKISIGGITGKYVHNFTNIEDKIVLGDISPDSFNAHFIIEDEDKLKIKILLDGFLNQ